MTRTYRFAVFACLAIVALAACSNDQPAPPANGEDSSTGAQTALGRTVENALEEARAEMATGNLGIGGELDIHVGGTRISRDAPRDADGNPLPKAEISPDGDLLIGGEAVAVTPEQRALLLDYRGHVVELVETGMALGVKGADLGMQAAGEALKSVITGGTADFEQRIEAEAAKIEAEAMKLCDGLPAMLETQQQLAASLPEFRPYATMEAKDIDECRDGSRGSHAERAELRAGVRDDIRSGIRESIRNAVRATGTGGSGTGSSEAAEAEAAGESTTEPATP
ncbi:hypothetical protein N799_10630 [Lysobacter arseniciresistens ZS79]|uniref:DUF2884 family protein n=1 Tax=Lysobacter arseniciresistens ZS79 TaxID=913325 RepID=A0A0A0F7D0_9GAMM|nr:hypothetical protein [Lysobacter arseniciresistens]KGM57277.1 hypothetical protein N799_10630 [Lysobacter arseniciresistens ZS79]